MQAALLASKLSARACSPGFSRGSPSSLGPAEEIVSGRVGVLLASSPFCPRNQWEPSPYRAPFPGTAPPLGTPFISRRHSQREMPLPGSHPRTHSGPGRKSADHRGELFHCQAALRPSLPSVPEPSLAASVHCNVFRQTGALGLSSRAAALNISPRI